MQIWCKYNTFYTKKKRKSLPKALILPKNLSTLDSRQKMLTHHPSAIIHHPSLPPVANNCQL